MMMMMNDHFQCQNAPPASSSLFSSPFIPPKLLGVLAALVATLSLYIIFVSSTKLIDYVDGGYHTDGPTPISIEPQGLQQQEQVPEQVSLIVYLFCWNEEDLLPYSLRHYAQFADKIVVLENNSTDSSQNIINQFAADLKKKNQPLQKPQTKKKAIHDGINSRVEIELRVIDTKGVYPEQWMLEWRTSKWKEARGQYDWAIVADMDEFVHFDPCNESSSFKHFLWEHRHDADVIAPIGYDMYYEGFPFPEPTTTLEHNWPLLLTEVAVQGYRTSLIKDQSYPTYSKPCIVQVNKVRTITPNYENEPWPLRIAPHPSLKAAIVCGCGCGCVFNVNTNFTHM